jgi:hypothetical protein
MIWEISTERAADRGRLRRAGRGHVLARDQDDAQREHEAGQEGGEHREHTGLVLGHGYSQETRR